jgi:hypothetical protein
MAGRSDDDTVAHHQLANELLDRPTYEPARGGLAAIGNELADNTDAWSACISSEDLSLLHDRPDKLARMHETVRAAGFTPRIIIFLRPQASYVAAIYAEIVRHGYRSSFADYFEQVVADGRYLWSGNPGAPFDYRILLDGFARVFGRANVVTRGYHSGAPTPSLLDAFARVILPAHRRSTIFDIPRIRHNPSLDFAGVLRHLNIDQNLGAPLKFVPLSMTDTLRLGRRFLLPNLALAQRYGIFVPPAGPTEIAAALPFRRTRRETQALLRARRALGHGA